MNSLTEGLRTGAWLTRERARLVAIVLLATTLAGSVFLLATSDGLNDRFGRPLATDFANVYAAGTYVLEGRAAVAYDPHQQYAREQSIFGADTQFYGWHYPPFFLALAGILALMPYWLALALWQGTTLALYALAIRAIVKFGSKGTTKHRAENDGLWLPLALAFPAVFINLGHGHNGFLTAALIAGALVELDRRPVLAGVLIGLMAYKPQFALLVPVALAASGRWRAFVSAALTVAALALAITLLFGTQVWTAFIESTAFTRSVVLEQGGTGWYKIQSVFSWVRLWGGNVTFAYLVQGAVTLGLALVLGWFWRTRTAYPVKASALLIGTVLATPYVLDYDLMLLAPAIAFLAVDGLTRGFAPWEKSLIAGLWLVPLLARSVTQVTNIPLAVPVMLLAVLFLLHRARDESHPAVHRAKIA